jgi:hypothetical protein
MRPPVNPLRTAFLALLLAAPAAFAADCAGLMGFYFPDTIVTAAVPVPGPSFTAPDGQTYESVPPFCRVSATLTPTSDSLINVEVWLPEQGWTGRFLGLGNGGYGGNIAIAVQTMVATLRLGFAVATTDMGTTPSANTNADALVGHPQKWVDFGHRATHLMTVVSKEIARAFYGAAPRYAYFHGCSTGGQQALMEAQRYPHDYDGIIAGAPANNRTHLHTNVLWFYRASRAAADSYITSDKVNLITRSVVAACNMKSGGLATDAFLTDPRACDWDPASIQCPALDGGECLLPGQVQTARAGYEGPRNPRNGRLIYPGWIRGSENASELGWNSQQSNAEPPFGSLFKWVFGSAWLWPTYDYDLDMDAVDGLLAPILNANNADLSAFRSRGGKLIAYHGTADPIINPQDTINYYNRVLALQSKSASAALKRTQQFFRLFLAPGVGHCSRGPGPNAFGNLFSASLVAPPPAASDAEHDVLLALVDWVERGNAPERIVAAKYAGDSQSSGVLMTRPLCPFPLFPRYSGSGDPNDAASFACGSGPAVTDRTAAPEYLQ